MQPTDNVSHHPHRHEFSLVVEHNGLLSGTLVGVNSDIIIVLVICEKHPKDVRMEIRKEFAA